MFTLKSIFLVWNEVYIFGVVTKFVRKFLNFFIFYLNLNQCLVQCYFPEVIQIISAMYVQGSNSHYEEVIK